MSTPMGEVVPGLLLECAIRVGLGGAIVGVIGVLLVSFLPFGSFALVVETSSLTTCLAAAALKLTRSGLCPTITDKDSEMRGREGDYFGST